MQLIWSNGRSLKLSEQFRSFWLAPMGTHNALAVFFSLPFRQWVVCVILGARPPFPIFYWWSMVVTSSPERHGFPLHSPIFFNRLNTNIQMIKSWCISHSVDNNYIQNVLFVCFLIWWIVYTYNFFGGVVSSWLNALDNIFFVGRFGWSRQLNICNVIGDR